MQLPPEIAETLTLVRYSAGTYTSGVWTPPTPTTASIRAFVEPAPPERMQALPEGKRGSKGILILTVRPLLVANEAAKVPADRITWDGSTWEVQEVDNLNRFKLAEAHYEALATRMA